MAHLAVRLLLSEHFGDLLAGQKKTAVKRVESLPVGCWREMRKTLNLRLR